MVRGNNKTFQILHVDVSRFNRKFDYAAGKHIKHIVIQRQFCIGRFIERTMEVLINSDMMTLDL